MSKDTEVGQAWIKNELFPRLKTEYGNRLRITDHHGWKTPNEPLQYTIYFEVEDMREVQLLPILPRLLHDCSHPHNTETRQEVEELIRQKFESLIKAGKRR